MIEDWAPQAQGHVATVEMEDYLVLLDDQGRLHVLNPTAAVIWRRCDGRTTLGQLVAEMSVGYDADPFTITRDLLDVLAGLVRMGLIREPADGDRVGSEASG